MLAPEESFQFSATTRRNRLAAASNNSKAVQSKASPCVDLESIVADCQAHSRSAQHQFYNIFHGEVYRLMVRMVGLQDAEDVLQQVFLQAFGKIGQFSGKSSFKTWFYRLALNEGLQHLRRNRRRQHHSLEIEPMDSKPSHERTTEQKELMEKALHKLDPELRSIFLLRETHELSYKEISEVLQIAEGTVASRLNRARRELKQILGQLGWEP